MISRRSLAAILQLRYNARYLHNTSVVYKKKSNVNGITDDSMFSDEPSGEEDLFKDEPSTTKTTTTMTSPISNGITADDTSPKKKRLLPEEREKRYSSLMTFVKPRIGRDPQVNPVKPQVRNSAWVHLVNLSTTKEQLEEIAGLFPAWKDSGREFNAGFSELFVRRCEELSCPKLAITVFGNYAKYNLKLTLPGARQLVHSVHLKEPVSDVLLAVALYDTYKLPDATSKDLVSCSMVLSALFKDKSEQSLKFAKVVVVPQLKQLLTRKEKEEEAIIMRQQKQKWDKWLKWSLKKVDKALFVQNGSRAEWLRDWRMRSGHLLESAQF